jgi:hypothetical protein
MTRKIHLTLGIALAVLASVLPASADVRAYERQHGDFSIYTVEVSTGRSNGWMTRIVDTKAGNTCYVFDLGKSMSCVAGIKSIGQ